jgi:hypothetical protein
LHAAFALPLFGAISHYFPLIATSVKNKTKSRQDFLQIGGGLCPEEEYERRLARELAKGARNPLWDLVEGSLKGKILKEYDSAGYGRLRGLSGPGRYALTAGAFYSLAFLRNITPKGSGKNKARFFCNIRVNG